jgi:hypothetical protein
MQARISSLGLRLLWRPLGFSSNKCVYYMHIKFSLNFHQNVFTLTIYFIALNVAIEFVLIYRPHPVKAKKGSIGSPEQVHRSSRKIYLILVAR